MYKYLDVITIDHYCKQCKQNIYAKIPFKMIIFTE